MDKLTQKQELKINMVGKAWEEIEIIINSDINDLCNQNRFSDAKDMENYRDVIKIALLMAGYNLGLMGDNYV